MSNFKSAVGRKVRTYVVIKDEPGQCKPNPQITVRCEVCKKTRRAVKGPFLRNKYRCPCQPHGRTTHGMSNAVLWIWWTRNHHKCTWKRFEDVLDFAGRSDVTLARLDQAKPFGPKNAVIVEPGRNASRRMVTIDGETLNLTQWSERLGVTREYARQLQNAGKLTARVLAVKG